MQTREEPEKKHTTNQTTQHITWTNTKHSKQKQLHITICIHKQRSKQHTMLSWACSSDYHKHNHKGTNYNSHNYFYYIIITILTYLTPTRTTTWTTTSLKVQATATNQHTNTKKHTLLTLESPSPGTKVKGCGTGPMLGTVKWPHWPGWKLKFFTCLKGGKTPGRWRWLNANFRYMVCSGENSWWLNPQTHLKNMRPSKWVHLP